MLSAAQNDRSEQITRDLSRIVKAIDDYSKWVQTHYGASGPQLAALSAVSKNRRLAVSRLAARMCLHPSTVSEIGKRLERKGLARRRRSTQDQRVVHLDITEGGRELLKNSPQPPRDRLLAIVKQLPDRLQIPLSMGLRTLAEEMETLARGDEGGTPG